MEDQPPRLNPYASNIGPTPPTDAGELNAALGYRRGMIGHIPILAVLMVIQGVLELLMAVAFAGYAVLMPEMFQEMQKQAAKQGGQGGGMPAAMPAWLTTVGVALAIVILIIGALTIYSGLNVYRFRGRVMAIVMLGAGLSLIFTCYCFPTALALAIYGLITLLNPSVKYGFDLRAQGHAAQDIQRLFA